MSIIHIPLAPSSATPEQLERMKQTIDEAKAGGGKTWQVGIAEPQIDAQKEPAGPDFVVDPSGISNPGSTKNR